MLVGVSGRRIRSNAINFTGQPAIRYRAGRPVLAQPRTTIHLAQIHLI